MDKKSLRFKVGICNIVIAVLCLLSIAAYFFMPFWKVSLSYTVSASTIDDLLNDMLEGEGLTDEEKLDINATEIIGVDGKTLSLSVTLKTTDILASLGGGANESVQALIDTNVSNMIDEIYPTLSEVVTNATKAVFKATMYSAVRDEIKAVNPDADSEEIERKLNQAGITEDYINGKIDSLMNTIENGAPVSVVSNDIVAAIDDSFNRLSISDSENFSPLTPEDKAEIKQDVEEILEDMKDKNGEINLDELLAQLLLDALEEDTDSESASNDVIAPMSHIYTAAAEEEMDALDELKVKLTDLLLEQIPSDVVDIIVLVMKIISGVFFFTAFTWLYILIKMLVKMRRTNNAVKLKLPIWLGWLPCLVLVLLPSLAVRLLKNPPSFLADMMGADAMAKTTDIMSNFSVSFTSGSLISFIVAMSFIVFCLAYYGRLRRKLRKIAKAEKRGEYVDSSKQPVAVEKVVADAPVDYKSDDYDPDMVDMDGYSDEELDNMD